MQGRTFEGAFEGEDEVIERSSTVIRILLTLLFAVIWSVAEAVLTVVVAFSLIWALVTRQAPPQPLREFSNRLVAYSYRIWRYMTYGEANVPFPFSEFPNAVEPTRELGADDAGEVRDMIDARATLDDDDLD